MLVNYYLRVLFLASCRSGDKPDSFRSFNMNFIAQEFRLFCINMVIREIFGQRISERNGCNRFRGRQTRADSAHPGAERTPDQI